MMTKEQFVRCYLTAVLFGEHCSNEDANGEYLDDVYTIDDFSPEALERATADCEAFLQDAEMLTKIAESFPCPDYYDADGKIYLL